MTNKKFYITTAIDYVNDEPHVGHAFEKVLADALARWHRLLGQEIFLLTGTDENAQKNVRAAKKAGISVQKFVDKNSKLFLELCKKLNVNFDDFVRTTEKRHVKKAQEIFKKVYDRGEIYKGAYEGHYCEGCEAFVTEKDLVDGKCPEHNIEPKWMSEEAYFFKLSRYKEKVIKFIENYIVPESKKNEILARLKEEELKDLCVSRLNLDWGIDSPIDKKFKIYVWFDALINYISGAGLNEELWPADLHIVGKGINWFHSVIWPAILLSAGYELPKKLLVHGYLNLKGKKISKTLGNVLNPLELAKKYSADTIRYSLLRCSVFDDSDYSEDILIERHNNELANKLGNLISRTASLTEKYGIETQENQGFSGPRKSKLSRETQNKLFKKLKLKKIEKHFENYEPDKALHEIFAFIDSCNEYIQEKKPWETKDKKVLYEIADSIRIVSILLWPFIPETAEKIAKQFGFAIKSLKDCKPGLLKAGKIKRAEILFKKI